MHSYDIEKIRTSIERSLQSLGLSSGSVRDSSFHLTDWLDDLSLWHRYCLAPHEYSDDEESSLIMKFLVHVPNHLNAAHKLVTGGGVRDIYHLGVFEREE